MNALIEEAERQAAIARHHEGMAQMVMQPKPSAEEVLLEHLRRALFYLDNNGPVHAREELRKALK